MIEWKDQTSFSRGETDRTPRVWTGRVGAVSIAVLRHRDYPDTWVMQCELISLWPRDLETNDVDDAKRKALDIVRVELQRALDALA